jgi:lysophospholipase L1-like esterase
MTAPRLAVIGDSNSQRFYDDELMEWHERWVDHLMPLLPVGSSLYRDTIFATTTADHLPTFEADVRYGAHDLFLLMLGTNDARGMGSITKEQCLANLLLMHSRAEAEGKYVVAMTILPTVGNTYLQWVNDGLRTAAAQNGWRLFDAYAMFDDPANPGHLAPGTHIDALHLNDSAQLSLGQAMYAALTALSAEGWAAGSSGQVHGTRPVGSTVTVTPLGSAVAGTVEYPTDITWRAPVVDLAVGTNSFSVSDGISTVSVSVEGIPGIVPIDASPASFALTIPSPAISLSLADRFKFPGTLKFWNGTAFVDAPFKSFDGSTLS